MPPLPGSTYRMGNASSVSGRRLFIASRKLLGHEPVRIQFIKEWATGNPLFDWYSGLESSPAGCLVHSIQLRKEHKQPFFHEYLVLSMGKEKKVYFRLERRQLENEDQPMNSLLAYGVEAYDTIEKTLSPDKHIVSSFCATQVDFKDGLHIAVILEICRAIHKHPSARVYTLQHFNCYFFAQTILLCTARATYQSNDMKHMIAHITAKYDREIHVDVSLDTAAPGDPPVYKPPKLGVSPLMLLREISQIPFSNNSDRCSYCWSRNPSFLGRDMDSSYNIKNLFWDGASQVIQEVLRSINTGDALQNVLWSSDSGQRLRDVCNAFLLWTVCDEWETLQKTTQRSPSEPAVSHESGCTQQGNAVGIQFERDSIGTPLESDPGSQLQKDGTRRSNNSANHHHQRELTDLLNTSYFEARKELVKLVSQASNQNEYLDQVLSTYYQASHWAVTVNTLPLRSESRSEKEGFKPLHDYIDQFIQAHAKRVAEHPLNALVLKCTLDEVANGVKEAMNDVWKFVCVMDLSTSIWEP
ncbi:unnamed protein product [Rhizoctonia solani]|uniref:Uncharacterized protein n=1 Tax=Rhizoctonia solani TaxID=456999 RepID=A0A8H3I0Q8_9AGAM|nr:unnamed protein product [Rhizoctonia solani]